MYNDVIGVLGGMGSYATLSFFERLLNAFPCEKEWERPRILIDNRCTMPSRVRAILYNENKDLLVEQLTDSVRWLLNGGATKIVFACNTSHYFLPMIYEKFPQAQGNILSIIDATVEKIATFGVKNVTLLASEGTINCRIFHNAFDKKNIEIQTPKGDDFLAQRIIIESVKQQKITEIEENKLINLINSAKTDTVILGCTEFPVIYGLINKSKINKKIIDPIDCIIEVIKNDIN